MGSRKINYGIDLGTTNSAIARVEDGIPVVKKIKGQTEIITSCVYFRQKGEPLVGQTASNSLIRELKQLGDRSQGVNGFREFKRAMGSTTTYSSSSAGRSFTPEELSSEVLKELKRAILDDTVSSVVITVPAHFGANQLDATRKAAELAGFQYCELIQEPIAASMAYGIQGSSSDGIWLVFDFGGGTFDAALVRSEDGIMRVFATAGDNHLGGKDLDDAIVDQLLIPWMQSNYAIDELLAEPSRRSSLRSILGRKAEEAKISLSYSDTVHVLTDLDELEVEDSNGVLLELDLELTRTDYEKVARPIFERAVATCEKLLVENGVSRESMSTVLLVGGPTHAPLLRTMVQERISSQLNFSVDPMTVVALGASVYAATIDIPEELVVRDKAKVQLQISNESSSVESSEWVTVVPAPGQSQSDLFVEFVRPGWNSGRLQLKESGEIFEVLLEEGRSNEFEVRLSDHNGNPIGCEPSSISIMHGIKLGGATLPKGVGVEIYDTHLQRSVFTFVPGLEKDASLPASGKRDDLRLQKQIRPGQKKDEIVIPLYNGTTNSEGSRAASNDLIYELVISGDDVPGLLPEGTEVELTVNVDRRMIYSATAYFPYLDETISLSIPTHVRVSVPSAEWLKDGISKLRQRLAAISGDLSTEEVSKLDTEISELQSRLTSDPSSEVMRDKVSSDLKLASRNLDHLERQAELPRLRAELEDQLASLKAAQDNYGDDGTSPAVNQILSQGEQVLRKGDPRLIQEVIEICRATGFRIEDQGAGVALELGILQGFAQDFETHDWSNPARAQQILSQAAAIVKNGPTKSELRPLVLELYSLLPTPKSPIAGSSGSLLVGKIR